jgi:hypothetical protein
MRSKVPSLVHVRYHRATRFARGRYAPKALASKHRLTRSTRALGASASGHAPRATPLAAGGLRVREKIANELPLPLVEFVSSYRGSSLAAELFFIVLRESLAGLVTRAYLDDLL